MTRVRVRLAHAPRDPDFPDGDDALGTAVWGRLVQAVGKGPVRPMLVAVFAEVAQLVDLPPVLAAGDPHRGIAAFASQPGAVALAAAGVMVRRNGGRVVGRFAMVFIEWPDGRWWSCDHPLDAEGALLSGVEADVQRAVDGAPKPGGLGGWFRRARFEQLALKWEGGEVN